MRHRQQTGNVSLPKLWARLAQVELQELLPDQRQERVIGGRGQSLLGPAVDHHPLQGGHHVQLQTYLSFLSTQETTTFNLLSKLIMERSLKALAIA